MSGNENHSLANEAPENEHEPQQANLGQERNKVATLQSINSRPFHVRFLNISRVVVDLTWINFTGEEVYFRSLNHGEYIDMNTFTDHIWTFREKHGQRRLLCGNNLSHFSPTRYFLNKMSYRTLNPELSARYIVAINFPHVYSLRYLCTLKVSMILADKDRDIKPPLSVQQELSNRMIDIDKLEIPLTLKQDIRRKIIPYIRGF